jgi:phage terminase large subunit
MVSNMNRSAIQRVKSWYNNAVKFVHEAIIFPPGRKPSDQQIDFLEALPHKKRISVMSGHGTGKDAGVSWGILWFMTTRYMAKVACTAPTGHQLADILWSELSKWLRLSILSDEFIIQKDKIFKKEFPKEWWCRAISVSARATQEEQAETLAGLHGDHLLIVADEASGIPDPVYIPLEGAMTQEDNKVILIGNPTKNTGYFYETHFHEKIKKHWHGLHWDSRESSNVSKEMVQFFSDKYGEESNIFRIRVAGLPPLNDDLSLIPLSWALTCIDHPVEVEEEADPLYLGVDVARFGDDRSVILPRQGMNIFPWNEFQGIDTIELSGYVLSDYRELGASGIAIDSIGIGAGVVDQLRRQEGMLRKVFGVNVSWASSNNTKWKILRDELWCRVRDRIRESMYRFPCANADQNKMSQELCNELASVRYKFDRKGAYDIESKRDMKLRGVHSPNIADALCLSEYFSRSATLIWGNKSVQKSRTKRYDGVKVKRAWMVM